MYFGSATQKLYHIFRLFRLRFNLFGNFLAAYFLVWAVVRPGPLTATMTAGFNFFFFKPFLPPITPPAYSHLSPPPLHTLCLITLIYAEFNLLNHYLRYQRSLKG